MISKEPKFEYAPALTRAEYLRAYVDPAVEEQLGAERLPLRGLYGGRPIDPLNPPVKGRKDDSGKVRMELLADMPRAIEAVAGVLTWAVTHKKPTPYEPGSWLNVSDFQKRYRGALGRHLIKLDKLGDDARDGETGLLELAHIATNALFKLERKLRDLEQVVA